MRRDFFTLSNSTSLNKKVKLLRFSGCTDEIRLPGQFVSIALPGMFLRRPFSVFDWSNNWFEVLIEEIGEGTSFLHSMAC